MASLTYRGISYQASVFETVETDRQVTFLGRKANLNSPLKPAASLPADIQFFGFKTVPATLERRIRLDIVEMATA